MNPLVALTAGLAVLAASCREGTPPPAPKPPVADPAETVRIRGRWATQVQPHPSVADVDRNNEYEGWFDAEGAGQLTVVFRRGEIPPEGSRLMELVGTREVHVGDGPRGTKAGYREVVVRVRERRYVD